MAAGGWTPDDDVAASTRDVERGRRWLPLAVVLATVCALGVVVAVRARDQGGGGSDGAAGPAPSAATIVIPDEDESAPDRELDRDDGEVTLGLPIVVLGERIGLVGPDGTRTDLGPAADGDGGAGAPDRALVVGRGQTGQERQTLALLWRDDGTGPVTAVALEQPRLRTRLAETGTVIPSSATSRFWLLTERDDGSLVVSERDVFGGATTVAFDPPGPVVADSGRGLVVEQGADTVVWNPFTGAIDSLGRADAFVATEAGRVVRCPGQCNVLYVVGGPIPEVLTTVELPPDWDLAGTRGLLDSTGRWLAAPVDVAGVPSLAVVEITTGTIGSFELPVPSVDHLSWAGSVLVAVAEDRLVAIDPARGGATVVAAGLPPDTEAVAAVSGFVSPSDALLWGVHGVGCCADGGPVAARPGELVWLRPDGSLTRVEPFGEPFDVVGRGDPWPRTWFLVRREDGRVAPELWTAGSGATPEMSFVDLPSRPVDLAGDGTRVAVLLEDGSVWADGRIAPGPAGGIALELVDGAPWVLTADGRTWRVDVDADGGSGEPGPRFDVGQVVDTAGAHGRFWVLDPAGRVHAEQPDGMFHYRSAPVARGARALVVDEDRVLAVGADGAVWSFPPDRPAEIVARLDLATTDGDVVDASVVEGELWFVTEAGELRRQTLDR